MNKTRIYIITLLLLAFFFSGYYFGGRNHASDATLLVETANILEKQFYKKIDVETLAKGMVNSLEDPYTVLLNPQESQMLQEEITGTYAGIGVAISINEKEDMPEIVSVFRGTPAEKAGLRNGDIITQVDSQSTKGMTIDEFSLKVRGNIGTEVTLLIKRNEDTLSFTILRARIEVPVVESTIIEDGKIGYIIFFTFTEGSASKLNNEIEKMKDKGVKAIILDLRDNSGGLLSECEKVSSYFIPSGTLYWTRDRDGNMTPQSIRGKQLNLPLCLIVNGGTASASEIFAAAIKAYDVGKIVGEKTYGKGVIQQIFDISEGYTLKVTIEEYLAANKSEINGKGVMPDYEVSNDSENPDEDLQLKKAIEVLLKEL